MNPYASARQAYTESAVMTASPEQLVVMLYDGAIRFLRQSAEAMRAGNREQSRNRMRRAEEVIDELNYSLDVSHGEVPQNLRMIYLFAKRQLIRANIDGDAARIDGVGRMLSDLRESWVTIARRAEAEAA
ncbi:MAG: flagellar secretion chaperone FliS [Gaiellales bacterium]|jgi:flagellar protein FliS|nr:flagellar secretion chaperone FliS [Gaiellales bacterium]MDX6596732.1 flagellar secretion chaperone FliS [Gaiellales bacterium]